MEIRVLHLLLLLIVVVILGYFGYKAQEGFKSTPAVKLSCVPTDISGSQVASSKVTSSKVTGVSSSGMDACGQIVSMNSLLGLAGAPPTDNG